MTRSTSSSERYLLDTNILSDLIRNPRGSVSRRLREVGEDRVCTSIIVAAELRYGAAKRGGGRLASRVSALLREIKSSPSSHRRIASMAARAHRSNVRVV